MHRNCRSLQFHHSLISDLRLHTFSARSFGFLLRPQLPRSEVKLPGDACYSSYAVPTSTGSAPAPTMRGDYLNGPNAAVLYSQVDWSSLYRYYWLLS